MPRYLTRKDIWIAGKPKPYATGEMEIRTRRHHHRPSRTAKMQTLITPNAGKDREQQRLPFLTGGNVKWYSDLGRQFGSFLQN